MISRVMRKVRPPVRNNEKTIGESPIAVKQSSGIETSVFSHDGTSILVGARNLIPLSQMLTHSVRIRRMTKGGLFLTQILLKKYFFNLTNFKKEVYSNINIVKIQSYSLLEKPNRFSIGKLF